MHRDRASSARSRTTLCMRARNHGSQRCGSRQRDLRYASREPPPPRLISRIVFDLRRLRWAPDSSSSYHRMVGSLNRLSQWSACETALLKYWLWSCFGTEFCCQQALIRTASSFLNRRNRPPPAARARRRAGHPAHKSRSVRWYICPSPGYGWWCHRHEGARPRAHGVRSNGRAA